MSFNNNMAKLPLLCSISRGTTKAAEPLIECAHRGLVAVVDADGTVIEKIGDITTTIHLRSTAKPFQLLPLLELNPTWTNDARLELRDLVLFMSSHDGSYLHTSRVEQILHSFGLTVGDLECGPHNPLNLKAQFDLYINHQKPTPIHNNCSGKHTAMLILCQKLGIEHKAYPSCTHHIQQLIISKLAKFAEIDPSQIESGIDGCSMPSFALPAQNIAQAYARLAFWQKEPELTAMWQAIKHHPEYLAGFDRFDTELIKASKGQLLSKSGADGMHAISVLPNANFPRGLGIVIKIADSDSSGTIRPFIIKEILSKYNLWPNEPKLDTFMPRLVNYSGITIGSTLSEIK